MTFVAASASVRNSVIKFLSASTEALAVLTSASRLTTLSVADCARDFKPSDSVAC